MITRHKLSIGSLFKYKEVDYIIVDKVSEEQSIRLEKSGIFKKPMYYVSPIHAIYSIFVMSEMEIVKNKYKVVDAILNLQI